MLTVRQLQLQNVFPSSIFKIMCIFPVTIYYNISINNSINKVNAILVKHLQILYKSVFIDLHRFTVVYIGLLTNIGLCGLLVKFFTIFRIKMAL